MHSRHARDDGWSLIELVVTVLILSILLAIAVASYTLAVTRTRKVVCEENRNQFDTAISIYDTELEQPPTSIDDLAVYVTNFDTVKICPGDLSTELRYDETENRVVCDYHE